MGKLTRRQLVKIIEVASGLQRRGHFIDSIRYLRDQTGSGLKEAKDAADIIRRRITWKA